METFIALLSHDAAKASHALDRAGRTLEGLFRHVYGELRFDLARHECGPLRVLTVRHASEDMASLVRYSDAADSPVCIFGDDPEVLLHEFATGGGEAARATDLAFGALSFDRDTETLTALGDVIGQRSLRFASSGDTTIVSPHDIAVLATGLLPFELDTASAASSFAVGWSLQGVPLARGLTRVQPMEAVTLTTSGSEVRSLRGLGVPVGSRATSPSDDVVAAQLAYLDATLPSKGMITVELSAGLDSRGSLAAALAVRPKHQLRVFSDGGPDSQDVRVAREIAKRVRVAFDNPKPVRPTHEAVIRELSHFAMAANGTGEALACMTNRATDFTADPDVSVSGDGGEVFSGYYFPYRPFRTLSNDGVRPKDAFRSKFRLSNVEWANAKLGGLLEDRLDTMLRELGTDSADALDTLDRLYLFERYGVWNNKLKRCHGNTSRFAPYSSIRGIRAAYGGSAEGKRNCTPHLSLIRTHLPEAISLPINGVQRLDLASLGEVGRLAGDGYEFGAKALRKVRRTVERKLPFSGGAQAESLHRVRSRVLVELLESGFEEGLRSSSSPAISVLGERELGRALDALRRGEDSQANMLAMAFMMNLYASLCADVAAQDSRFAA
ncbi:MAG: hypothetical protein ACRBN8_02735 [Nannocystales bacterium]